MTNRPISISHSPRPWSAPSAGVFDANGLLVCQLGSRDVVRDYRRRGDGAGEMIGDNARLIAAAPELLAIALEIAKDKNVDLRDSERRIRLYSVLNSLGVL